MMILVMGLIVLQSVKSWFALLLS